MQKIESPDPSVKWCLQHDSMRSLVHMDKAKVE
jgi:hypothetical protein